jgi:hypothetical protein
MRNRHLHAALGAFAEEAAWQLAAATADGAEVPFEVVAAGGRGDAPLYCYQPLTGDFIDQKASLLGRLESYLPAVHALLEHGGALDGYLHARGEPAPATPRERADAALRAFLARTFADSTEFALVPERLKAAYAELEDAVYEARTDTAVIAPLLGLEIASDEVALGHGLVLVAADRFAEEVPHEALWAPGARRARLLAALRWEDAPGDAAPVAHARVRLRRLLTALRLYDTGSFAFGPVGWTRTGAGPWEPFALGVLGHRLGEPLVLAAGQEDELRAFCSLISRRMPRHGPVAWALRRFEMACERTVPGEALTDNLLALRALLAPDPADAASLPQRLGALCATPEERIALSDRTARALAAEQALVAGGAADPSVDALADELGGHVRALLRDVLCGHLDSDLRDIADAILSEPLTAPAPVPAAQRTVA